MAVISTGNEFERRIADAEARELATRSGTDFRFDQDEDDDSVAPSFVRESGNAVLDFVRRHPLTAIGGAIALGAAISLLIPNSPTRRAGKALGKKAAGTTSALRDTVSQFFLSFGAHLLDVLEEAQDSGKERLSDASRAAGKARAAARRSAAEAGKRISGAISRD